MRRGCGVRQDADADAQRDHPAHGVEAAHLHPHLERLAQFVGRLAEQAQQGRAAFEPDEVAFDGLGKAHAAACRQRVARWQQQHQFIQIAGHRFEPRRRDVVGEDAQVRGAGGDRAHHRFAQGFFEIELGRRVGREVAREGIRQEAVDCRGVGPQAHVGLDAAPVVAHRDRQSFQVADQAQRVAIERLAGGRRRHALLAAREQRGTGIAFEFHHALAGGGERNAEVRRAGGQAAGIDHGDKNAQRYQVEVREVDHGGILSFPAG